MLALFAALALSGLTAASALASGKPIVETKPATSIGGIEAKLNGNVNANGAATTYSFEYGTTTAYGSKTGIGLAAGTTTKEVGKFVESLTANTTYHFRIVATNGNGTSNGADEVFTTEKEKPEFVVKTGEKLTQLEYIGSYGGGASWVVGQNSFRCTGGYMLGVPTSPKTVQGRYVFTGCKTEQNTCKSLGAKENEIRTEELKGTLVYISKSAKTVGIVFEPKSGAFLAKFSCSYPYTNEVRGAIIVPVAPVNVLKVGFSEQNLVLQFKEEQGISEYENGRGEKVHRALETTWPGGPPFKPLGWEVPGFSVLTNKELEIEA